MESTFRSGLHLDVACLMWRPLRNVDSTAAAILTLTAFLTDMKTLALPVSFFVKSYISLRSLFKFVVVFQPGLCDLNFLASIVQKFMMSYSSQLHRLTPAHDAEYHQTSTCQLGQAGQS